MWNILIVSSFIIFIIVNLGIQVILYGFGIIVIIFLVMFFLQMKVPIDIKKNQEKDNKNIRHISTFYKKNKIQINSDINENNETESSIGLIKNLNNYQDGVTLLYQAILDEDVNQVELLLKSGVDINKVNSNEYKDYKNYDLYSEHRNKTILKSSVEVGNVKIIKLLVNYNANINTLLCFAIEKDQNEIIKFLIEENNDFNEISLQHNSRTPLSLAVSKNKFEYTELLIQKGANVNKISGSSFYKSFPLRSACVNQDLKIIKLLIDNGANPNLTGDDGRISLFDAIEATKANKEIIRFLIANGANIHQEDKNGITPLSFAESNKVSLVKVLTEHQEVELFENMDTKVVLNYQDISEKIVLQNQVINKLKDEMKTINNNDEDKQIQALKQEIKNFERKITSQSNEINEFQNKLISKEEYTKNLVDSLMLTISKLEKKFETQNKVVKTNIPLNIPIENYSVKKEDGILVKRDSFDDF